MDTPHERHELSPVMDSANHRQMEGVPNSMSSQSKPSETESRVVTGLTEKPLKQSTRSGQQNENAEQHHEPSTRPQQRHDGVAEHDKRRDMATSLPEISDGTQEPNPPEPSPFDRNETCAEKQADSSDGVEHSDRLKLSQAANTSSDNIPRKSSTCLLKSTSPKGDRIPDERESINISVEPPKDIEIDSALLTDRSKPSPSHSQGKDRPPRFSKKLPTRKISDRLDLRTILRYTAKDSPSNSRKVSSPVRKTTAMLLEPGSSAREEQEQCTSASQLHESSRVQAPIAEAERKDGDYNITVLRENSEDTGTGDVNDSANKKDTEHIQPLTKGEICSANHESIKVNVEDSGVSQDQDHMQICRDKMDCSRESEPPGRRSNGQGSHTPTEHPNQTNTTAGGAKTSVTGSRGNHSSPVAKRARPAPNGSGEDEDKGQHTDLKSEVNLKDHMEISPVRPKRESQVDHLSEGLQPANPAEEESERRQENMQRATNTPTSESLGLSKTNFNRTNSSPNPKKRGRSSPTAVRRKVVQSSLPREEMINKAFAGRVELSAYCGHRIIAHVGGQELAGWVLDADMSNMENRDHSQEHEKVERKEGENGESLSFPADIRPKPRKLPVARRSRRVVPLIKDCGMDINNLGCVPTLITGSDVPRRSVIIIGAGIAGIAAARALKDRGFVVTVLEARRRLGGRIATDWSMGSPVELGAAFIHGCYGNPLSEIAREGDLRTYSPSDVGSLIYANGQRVSPADDRHAEQVWKALLSRAGSIAKGSLMKHSSVDIALGKLLNRLKEEVVDGCNQEVTQLLAWHAANLEAACASEMKDLSAKHYDMDDKSGFSGSHKLVRDGYASIVHALARNLEIHYNSEVLAVQRDVPIHLPAAEKANAHKGNRTFGSKQYQEALLRDVHTESGKSRNVRYLDGIKRKVHVSTEADAERECTSQRFGVRAIVENGKEYVAESCIVTLPLGVLQKGDVAFLPPLPAWKRDAIHNVGFGLVNKVVLRFDSPFWVDEWNPGEDQDDDDEEGPDHIGRVSSEHGVFYMFLSLLRCVGAPILVAITSGRFAEHIEKLSDEEVVKMALEALRNMFPSRTVATLLSHSVTRWKTDKYARGSYSYAKVGTTPQDYTRISDPVGTLSFAGEATHRNHPATAHGAFMSGIREAARLIERSDLSEEERRKYARDLFLMQEPHASFEKAVTCNGGAEMGSRNEDSDGANRYPMTNGSSDYIPNGSATRRKKRNSQNGKV